MTIFEFNNYKNFIRSYLKTLPKRGHGQYRKFAQALGMHTTLVSQVFNGDKDLNLDQASDLSDFLGLNAAEADYFLTLVEHARAASYRLKQKLQTRLENSREKSKTLKTHIDESQDLSDENKAIFYSRWYYAAIHLLVEIEKFNAPEEIAKHLNLPIAGVREALEFLTGVGLCLKQNNKYKVGKTRTFIPKDSFLVTRHHQNWRLRSQLAMENLSVDELVVTAPVTLTKNDAELVHREIIQLIKGLNKMIEHPKPEVAYCLNVDWFKIIRND